MSIKNLFGKSFKNYDSASVNVESPTFVNNEVVERQTYIPPIDFSTASNFVKYGSAKLYYEDSIKRIYNNFPYDGSKSEIIQFHQSSSYLDRWMFDVKYPKTTGYIELGQTADYGSITNGYGATTTPEFIKVFGGMHTASLGMVSNPLRKTFDLSIKYNKTLNRTQNWRLNIPSGSTVEFWLKKDSFNVSNSTREVILDLWNGEDTSSSDYGRLTIELIPSASVGCFVATLQSGSSGFFQQTICSSDITVSTLTSWHHYAMSFTAAAGGISTRFYLDGTENHTQTLGSTVGEIPGLINGYIGALQTAPMGTTATAYAGKFSGSLDEFRYWKTRRPSRDIGYNWFRQVGGGANTDKNTTDLGVYFKFNEGIAGTTAIDSTIVDYSGRIANGNWQGYTNTARFTGSAFNDSSYNLTESLTPIIYSDNPRVSALSTEMTLSGSNHDEMTGSSMFQSLPTWLIEEDEATNQNLKKTVQIMASYFDNLYAQITAMPNLKNKTYVQSEFKAIPFVDRLLENQGFVTQEIFVDADIAEMFSNADFNAIKYEQNITEIKNLIYTNIYNNLDKIYKSKGTEKSVRNLIRCFGIDDEIIKLNVYTDGGTHYLTDKAKATSIRKKYINFDSPLSFSSTLYQTSSANNRFTFISGTVSTTTSNGANNAFTLEADIIVPHKIELGEIGYYQTQFTQSSIFGFHQALETYPWDYAWASGSAGEIANLQVFLLRDKIDSKDAKFLIKNQSESIYLTSSYIQDIYDNNHWNIAIRVKPDTYPYAGNVTNTTPTYTLDIYGVNYNIDEIKNEFYLTSSLNNASGSAFLTYPKRVYAGAHVTNFTGSVSEKSDVQIGAVRAWLDYVENSAIQQHNKDVSNFGISEAFRESNIFTIDNIRIPSQELTIFNWDFDTVMGSDASGEFLIDDITSGSNPEFSSGSAFISSRYQRYGWIDGIIRREYKGLGADFSTSATSFIENEFLYSQKKELPEISYTNDNIFIKGEKQINFIKDDDVSDNFYLLEKSMNQIVSEEMMKLFSSVQEFSNLIGRPVDSYRQSYKRLATIREHFFQRVEQDLDLEKFIQYYKWIDGSISKMISQLIPASVNFGEGVTDIIESHILERNKYQRRIGLLDTIESTEGIATGIEELSYSWKYGHAPQENWIAQNEKYVKIIKSTDPASSLGVLKLASPYFSPSLGSQDWSMHGWFKIGANFNNRNMIDLAMTNFSVAGYAVGIQFRETDGDIYVSLFGGTNANNYRTYMFAGSIVADEWFHFVMFLDYSEGVSSDALKVYLNGQLLSLASGVGSNPADGPSWTAPSQYNSFDRFQIKSQLSSGDDWNMDALGFSNSTITLSLAQELYNSGRYFNILQYSDLANVLVHWNLGDGQGDSASNGGKLYPQYGSPNIDVNSTTNGTPVFDYYPASSPLRGITRITQGNNNCLWRKERHERSGSTDREAIREILVNQTNATSSTLSQTDKSTYQGSTYIPRRLSRPYRLGIDFSDSIHGGINYSKQKNRNWVKEVTTVHGREGASGAPVNVFGIGIGLTDGINEKQQCRDVYDPNKKDYYNATTQVGKFSGDSANAPLTAFDDYQYKLKASNYWPFNILSGTLNSGYNARIYNLFRETAVAVNLHSDTIDITNEIPMQGPFTETHVGGAQNRHVPLNKSSSYTGGSNPAAINIDGKPFPQSYNNGLDNLYTRPEAWRLLLGDNPASMTPDGAMGFTGPDYGGPYPDTEKSWAIYYREPKAKRPVNISNIQSTTGSSVLGNYQQGYEFLSTFSNQRYLLRRKLGSLLPDAIAGKGQAAIGYIEITDSAATSGALFWLSDSLSTVGANGSSSPARQRFSVAGGITRLDGDTYIISQDTPLGITTDNEANRILFAINFAGAINAANAAGHTAITATVSGQIVILAQPSEGVGGNLEINNVNTRTGVSYTDFAGGVGPFIGMNETTNYMTLVGQAPYMSGNVFGAPNNNRQPTTDSVVYTNISDAFMLVHIRTDTWRSDHNPSLNAYTDGMIAVNRENNPPIGGKQLWSRSKADFISNGWKNGSIIDDGGYGNGHPAWMDTGSAFVGISNIIECYNSPNVYGGNAGVCSTTASMIQGPRYDNDITYPGYPVAVVLIKELQAPGPFGNTSGYAWTRAPGMGAIQSTINFASGAFDVSTLYGNKNSIEIPRTDLTSSKNTITTRFSAPGGPEVNSRGYLDIATGQYSVYNSINYRNYTVRSSGSGEFFSGSCGARSQGDDDVQYATGTFGMNYETIRVQSNIGKLEGQQTLLSRHCGKGGMDSQWGTMGYPDSGSVVPLPAAYKQHRNTLIRPKIVDTKLRNAVSSSGGVGWTAIECNRARGYEEFTELSFGFWIRRDRQDTNNRYVMINTDRATGHEVISAFFDDAGALTGQFKVKISSGINHVTNFTIGYDFDDYYGEWTYVTITWDRSNGTIGRNSTEGNLNVYFNSVLQRNRNTAGTPSWPAEPYRQMTSIRLMDSGVTVNTDSLGGEIADFAIFKTMLSPSQIDVLYNSKGIASSLDYRNLLGDFWRLGTELGLEGQAIKTQLPSGSGILSDIGANTLTVGSLVSLYTGPYTINVAGDVPQYNNMFVTSMLPQSDFQYSWINNGLSGSAISGSVDSLGKITEGYLSEQKVRGYAPKSGLITLQGGGSIRQQVSAITFPTSSQLYGESNDY